MSRIAIIGRGRVGTALSAAVRAAGRPVEGPLGRGETPSPGVDAVLLCVPDAAIASVAATLPPGPLVGHCSGATPVAPLCDFGLHPLMTVTGEGAVFAGAGGAIGATTPEALAFARGLADDLGMNVIEIADSDRPAYHAAASIASNFLVTLESAAERMLGGDRELLVPLVRATVENWARQGDAALTGPIARGDEVTVARQRAAVQDRAPDLVAMFDALVDATRGVAGGPALPADATPLPADATPLPSEEAA
ncbi:MAG TPA: DUF2520 domain-containing protein [Solirubrobacteraceae bacterium]|jgi:predicted short-subunit dehydrogenase-like oxidoreductase (DUF2520 family)